MLVRQPVEPAPESRSELLLRPSVEPGSPVLKAPVRPALAPPPVSPAGLHLPLPQERMRLSGEGLFSSAQTYVFRAFKLIVFDDGSLE